MKLLIFTVLLFTFALTASAQEKIVTISQETADRAAAAFAEATASRTAIETLKTARVADGNVITAQTALIASYQALKAENATEIKELREMILELSKLVKPRGSRFCIAICIR